MTDAHQAASEAEKSLPLLALYPEPAQTPLQGLYLSHDLRRCRRLDQAYVYSNFITSLDGRIAVVDPGSGEQEVPSETANPRDWRLLLELAVPADALIIGDGYVRRLAQGRSQALPPLQGDVPAELTAFREALGLPPQPVLVVVTNDVDVPVEALLRDQPRTVIVATSDAAGAEPPQGLAGGRVELVRAGRDRVEGGALVAALAERDLKLVYSIAGPGVLHTLLAARVLHRLYLTTVLRVLGGEEYATIARGPRLSPPCDFRLAGLYLDPGGPGGVEQLLQVFEHRD
jgi:riboflavin biosynthesis pyrimidine reductase